MQYRVRETGEVKNQGEIRRLHPNTSFPKVWNTGTCDFIGVDPILESPRPDVTNLQMVSPDGVEQDSLGNWVYKFKVVNKFKKYTEEDGTVHTKAQQEKAFLKAEEDRAFSSLRVQRNRLLVETDFHALTDVTITPEMTTYRQTLRDLPSTVDINNIIYPEKPEE
jgi:hypothetical protein